MPFFNQSRESCRNCRENTNTNQDNVHWNPSSSCFVNHPIGDFQAPIKNYSVQPFFNGFREGYLTMDTLASFVFGIIIINAIKEKGAKTKKQIMVVCAKATGIAALFPGNHVFSSSYMGASSVEKLGHLENGGTILAKVSDYYFGAYGGILLGLMITVACLTTSVGLVTSCFFILP